MNDELDRVWMEVVVAYFKAFQRFPRGTVENAGGFETLKGWLVMC